MPYKLLDFLSIDVTDKPAASIILMNDDGQGRKFLWNVDTYRPVYTVSPPCKSNRHGWSRANLKSDKVLRNKVTSFCGQNKIYEVTALSTLCT